MTTATAEAPSAVRTEYAGFEVVKSMTAPARHPRWGYEKLTVLRDAHLLLLSDNTYVVVCDLCDFNGLTGREPYQTPVGSYKAIIKQSDSTMAHLGNTHWMKGPRTPNYTDEQIIAILVTFLRWKNSGVRNYAEEAAEELNRAKMKPWRSEKWSAGSISSIHRHYIAMERFEKLALAMTPAAAALPATRVQHDLPEDGQEKESEVKTAVASADEPRPGPLLSFGGVTTNTAVAQETISISPGDINKESAPVNPVVRPAPSATPAMMATRPQINKVPVVEVVSGLEILRADEDELLLRDGEGEIWVATRYRSKR